MKNIKSIFNKIYLITFFIVIIFSVSIIVFFKFYLNKILDDAQLAARYKKGIQINKLIKFENIEVEMLKKITDKNRDWQKVKDPF